MDLAPTLYIVKQDVCTYTTEYGVKTMVRRREEGNGGKEPAKKPAAGTPPVSPDPLQAGLPGQGVETADAALEPGRPRPSENRKILVAGEGETFANGVMDYAVNLAERLGYEIIALNVSPELGTSGFLSPYKRYLREQFRQRAAAAAAAPRQKVAAKGLRFEHLVRFGDLSRAIEDVNHEFKRIEFVITSENEDVDEMTAEVTLPVFAIKGDRGESIMVEKRGGRNMKLIGKTIGLGLASAALYAAVFTHAGTVMKFFTKGGWYAALPVATVFVFSFVHGAFASNLWSVLGIEAIRKVVQPQPEVKRPVRRKRPRPELRLKA
jgi:hypothetical protein